MDLTEPNGFDGNMSYFFFQVQDLTLQFSGEECPSRRWFSMTMDFIEFSGEECPLRRWFSIYKDLLQSSSAATGNCFSCCHSHMINFRLSQWFVTWIIMDAQQKFLLVTSILRLYSSNYFSVLTDNFDSINALVAVHATMIFDMLMQAISDLDPSLQVSPSERMHGYC